VSRVESSADHLQQSGLAAAISPNDANRLALPNLERYVPEGPELSIVLPPIKSNQTASTRQDELLESITRVVIDVITLAQVFYLD
jgi:hypothetical protein